MRMRHWLFVVSFVPIILGGGMATAYGGTKEDDDVVISKTAENFTASGSMGTARSTTKLAAAGTPAAKEIGCYLDTDQVVTCRAVMDTNQAQCVVLDRDLRYTLLLGMLTGDSYLQFKAVGSEAIGWTCTYIMVDNNSKYFPKIQ